MNESRSKSSPLSDEEVKELKGEGIEKASTTPSDDKSTYFSSKSKVYEGDKQGSGD